MKSSFQTDIQNTQNDGNSLNGIGPTTAQTQGASNAQAEQAQNQLAKPSLPFTLTDFSASLSHHGYFILPLELFTQIFQFLPSMKNPYSMENLSSRVVSKPFYLAWENAAKNLFFSSKPAIHHLGLEQGCNTLHEQQQTEIKYLIENKEEILKQNDNDPRLKQAFAKLALLENYVSVGAYQAKEKCLNSLSETIIRIEIAKVQKSNNPTALILVERHLTRFPSGIISDDSLSTFWKKITHLNINHNQLTVLPDTIRHCAALKMLSVRNNQLITLPDTIGQCVALQFLYVDKNQLTVLPNTIGQCTALFQLCLTENKFITLPNGLREDIKFLDGNLNYINKAQCLSLQKKALIDSEKETMDRARSIVSCRSS